MEEAKMKPTKWEAASGSGNKNRNWWVGRYLDGPGVTSDPLTDGKGRLRTFNTYREAKVVADKLNLEDLFRIGREADLFVKQFYANRNFSPRIPA
jgi:hypothetical protein